MKLKQNYNVKNVINEKKKINRAKHFMEIKEKQYTDM